MSAELPHTALPSYGAAAYDPTGDGTPVGVELDRLAADEPDAPAVTCNDVTLSRAELASRSNRLARHLAGLGVRRGDMMTIGLPNGWEFYVAVVAAWKLGAVPQPVSARLPVAELATLIEIADPAVVLGLQTRDGRPWLPRGFEPDPVLGDGPLPPAVPTHWKAPTSGGSTGCPKIILAAAAGTTEAIVARADATRVDRGSVLLVTAPLYHNAPLTFSLMALVNAGHVVVMERFDPADVLDRISRHRATWVYAVPTLMGRMLRLAGVDRAVQGAGALRRHRVDRGLYDRRRGLAAPPGLGRATCLRRVVDHR